MAEKGVLIIVSAPSGCGKSTVLQQLMRQRETLRFSVSATTRAPRAGEVDGREYFFVSRERFAEMVEQNEFLEHAEYVGNCYGTPKAAVDAMLADGYDVYLDIDVQGAMQIKEKRPETLMIFLLPPSMEELERRLVARGTDSEQVIRGRLQQALEEIRLSDQFDYTVVNDTVECAADEISAYIDAHKKELNK